MKGNLIKLSILFFLVILICPHALAAEPIEIFHLESRLIPKLNRLQAFRAGMKPQRL